MLSKAVGTKEALVKKANSYRDQAGAPKFSISEPREFQVRTCMRRFEERVAHREGITKFVLPRGRHNNRDSIAVGSELSWIIVDVIQFPMAYYVHSSGTVNDDRRHDSHFFLTESSIAVKCFSSETVECRAMI